MKFKLSINHSFLAAFIAGAFPFAVSGDEAAQCAEAFNFDFTIPFAGSPTAATGQLNFTRKFTEYLAKLIEVGILPNNFASRWLEKHQAEMQIQIFLNYVNEKLAQESMTFIIQRRVLTTFSDRSVEIDPYLLTEWLNENTKKSHHQDTAHEKSSTENSRAISPIIWIPIESGSYQLPENSSPIPVKAFAVMDRLVTQERWAYHLMGNPSHFKSGIGTDIQTPNGEVWVLDGMPVEMITWLSAAWFANILSEYDGLKPVYDFSACKGKLSGSAAKGTLVGPFEGCVGYFHAGGAKDFSGTEGYRLPTKDEMLYLFTDLGRINGGPPIGGELGDSLLDYAWLRENSVGKIHAVGTRKPVFFGGKPIYDLIGNVMVWINDRKLQLHLSFSPEEALFSSAPKITSDVETGDAFGLHHDYGQK